MDATVVLRVYAELQDFVDGGRGDHVEVPIGAPRSVKDVVESVGVPHPEIALLLVDGASVDFGHMIRGGERIAVYPRFHRIDATAVSHVAVPVPAPRFVCDVHLGRLTRRLRLLGFDSWYRTDADDDELARVAVGEERVLLTRDRGLLMRKVITHGYCPRSDDADTQAIEVLHRYDLVDAITPLSRCARCNGRLRPVAKRDVLHLLPPRTRVEHDHFAQCGACDQVYWSGSHTTRIRDFVRTVRATAPTRTMPLTTMGIIDTAPRGPHGHDEDRGPAPRPPTDRRVDRRHRTAQGVSHMTTDKDRDKTAGKGFAPGVSQADDETEAMTTHGGGKQFSPDVEDPEVNERARQTEGSAKQFAPDVHESDEPEEHHATGTGKQWEPDYDDE